MTPRAAPVFAACRLRGRASGSAGILFLVLSAVNLSAAWAVARPLTEADAARGKSLYLAECSACHGDRGNGAGPAAEFLNPRPQDFTTGRFKIRTTASGRPPATRDILRTIERGLPGSAMPSFAFLPEDARRTIAAYVLKLAGLLDKPEPVPLHIGVPPAITPKLLAQGKEIYAGGGCPSCHGESGKGDGRSAPELKDDAGRPAKPRDLTAGVYRGGGKLADIYYRLATGMDGTPMPSFADSLSAQELWALASYVASLRVARTPEVLPGDPIAAGREIAKKYSCQGCHVLDDGSGGDVGPDLRVSGRQRSAKWIRRFLTAPRTNEKLYPARIYRMPMFSLSAKEVASMTQYIVTIGKPKEAADIRPRASGLRGSILKSEA